MRRYPRRGPAIPPELQETADSADRLEFAFQFETVLHQLTTSLVSRNDAETALTAERRQKTGHPAIDKALCLFHRIRQEAALRLEYAQNRPGKWHDEYYFALSVYGVLDQATRQVEELRPQCPVFGDEETLCCPGRIHKNLGDKAWQDDPS